MKHTIFQLGVVLLILIYVFFCFIYTGQAILDLWYYFMLPVGITMLVYSYPFKNALVHVGLNTMLAVCVHNLFKLIHIYEYDYRGIKIMVPSVFIISVMYYMLVLIKKNIRGKNNIN